MVGRVATATVSLLSMTCTALAGWTVDVGDDPMSDRKWVEAITDFTGGGMRGIILKCWTGGSVQVGVMIGRYADEAHRKEAVEVSFRVDQGDVVKLRLSPASMNGNMILTANVRTVPEIIDLVRSIGGARKRIGTAFTGVVFQAPAAGAEKAVRRMAEVCGCEDCPPSRGLSPTRISVTGCLTAPQTRQ
jgi:hypothetical protein